MSARSSFTSALAVWARVGLNSFGGPAGQISVMHRELVERQRWIDEKRFLHALNYCMVLPGPEAQQLATYIGWLTHGVAGGVAAGLLFIVPGVLAMLGLSIVYVVWGTVPLVAGLLAGLQAAVVVLVIQAMIRLSKRTLHSTSHVIAAVLAFLAMAVFHVPFPIIIVLAGVFFALISRAPTEPIDARDLPTRAQSRASLRAAATFLVLWVVPLAALLIAVGTANVFAQEAVFFSKTALVTFGGAYAVLGYVTQEAVNRYGWLTANEMSTGLGLAETTPGPLVLVLQFVGFLGAYHHPGSLNPLLAGCLGALVTVWMTFVPCFLFIFAGAPFAERLRGNGRISAALSGVSAVVVGVIGSLAVTLALGTFFTATSTAAFGIAWVNVPELGSTVWSAVFIAVVAAVLVFRFHLNTFRLLAISAGLGLVAQIVLT